MPGLITLFTRVVLGLEKKARAESWRSRRTEAQEHKAGSSPGFQPVRNYSVS
jgi:hypothetical protein